MRAQDAVESRFASWAKVETADATREYKEKLKEAGSLDQASRTFLLQDALPQLAREENRSSIERVRRRMREVLLTEIGNPQVLAATNGVVADFMETLARDGAADPVARVNAAIMIGELRGQDGRPWPDALPRLTGLAKDQKVSAAVRIAAVTGLSRFGQSLAATPENAASVGQAVMGILAEPAGGDRPEQDWLASRAVTLLPTLVAEYPKGVAEQLVKIVTDESRSTDLRVRAALALGARAGAKSEVDAGQAVAAIEAVAIRTLADDVESAKKKRFHQQYQQFVGGKAAGQVGGPAGAGGDPGGMAAGQGGPSMIPDKIARREAWRLIALAGALDGGDGAMTVATAVGGAAGGKGIAGVAQGPAAEKAKALAATLRQAALSLDADPSEKTVVAALERLRPTARKPKPKGSDDQPVDAAPDKDVPAKPAAPQPSPFEASPFG